ncbi:MAG: DUF535 domain-containing protein [Selenomonadaceae bacterium]|nr:DUF535 domain-containing protein [Selenomonadaceae bacterium]
MQKFIELGKKIYDLNNPREVHRFAVFIARCVLNSRGMHRVIEFFDGNELLRRVADNFPYVFEQPTRAFFYHRSTFEERVRLIEEHMTFLQSTLKPSAMLNLYSNKKIDLRSDKIIKLWSMELGDELGSMSLILRAEPGQRKEGLAALMLVLPDGEALYQIIFWIAKDRAGEWSMWIGALQGPNMDGAKDIIKKITKKCHAYRTKNLMLYAAQAFARTLGLKNIYAVTNEGYYANNHVRRDRKLKTSLSDFWQEAGGEHTDDARFDRLPLVEKRKTVEEIPSHKRATYRRRFALLDQLDEDVRQNLLAVMA